MFKILDEACKPTKGSKYSAGIDLYAREDITIGAGETRLVPLGVKIDGGFIESMYVEPIFGEDDDNNLVMIDQEFFYHDYIKFIQSHHLELFNRSSTALKRGLMLANGTGIIDLDFEDEICALLHNPITGITKNPKSDTEWYEHFTVNNNANQYFTEIKKGDKICQIILKENKSYLMGIESEDERTGGFGSSGS